MRFVALIALPALALAACADKTATPPQGSSSCPAGSHFVPASERPTPGSPACQPIEGGE